MTYTFKLARRLAVSRRLGMLPVILLFAACSGDATAPESSTGPQGDWRAREAIPVNVSVNPSNVTVETNQPIRFRASARNGNGDSVHASVAWRATGGTIQSDGLFSSAAVGTFRVIGRTRLVAGRTRTVMDRTDRVQETMDTSIIRVVRRQPNLRSIAITPDTATLAPGASQAFLVSGRLSSGRTVPVGVTWSAGGGTIDAGGQYVAGDTAGTYQVIATHATMAFADTARVTINAPPPPAPPPAEEPPPPAGEEPPPPPAEEPPPPAEEPPPPAEEPPPPAEEPPPAPVLAKVTMLPASVTLAPSTTRQFTAQGTTATGDSMPVSVVFSATGGTVTPGGLYTAGPSAGSFRVIASANGLADTSSVTITVPLGSGGPTGIPFGPFALFSGTSTIKAGTAPFSLGLDPVQASTVVARIEAARALRLKIVPFLVGGAHCNYNTPGCDANGNQIVGGKFDLAKWKARAQTYNTPEIKAAIAAGVSDGTILGTPLMDEPEHVSWGPAGSVTKPMLDEMAAYLRAIHPTLPIGVNFGVTGHRWRPTEHFTQVDYIVNQYAWWITGGDVAKWRDLIREQFAIDRVQFAWSMNILGGGIHKRDGLWDCPLTTTGGRGPYEPLCRMHPTQVRDWGQALGPYGCLMLMWEYNADFMAKAENQQAFRDVAATLANAPAKSCRKP